MRRMVEAGAPIEAIIMAVDAVELAQGQVDEARAKAAERKRRQRDRERDSHATVTGQSQDIDAFTPSPAPSLSSSPDPSNKPTPTPTPVRETPTRTRAGCRMPDDWQPILTARVQQIVDGWPPGKIERELRRFRDHASDKGRTSKDWQAAFRTWIEKADEDGTPRHHNRRTDRDDIRDPMVRAILASEAAGSA